MMDNPDCRVRFHDWWQAPRTWATVLEIDPEASHGGWVENFPWTRLPATPADDHKPMVDVGRLRTLPPFEARNLLEDGSFGGRSQRADAEMLAIWRIAVQETREMLEDW
jgi:creatinine amidohydrolase